jgi:hypothetical protein
VAAVNSASGYGEVDGPGSLPLNAWSYLTGTYDGATLRMYVNGTLVASQAYSGGMLAANGPLQFGGNSIWGEYFSGLIDEVRIYNRPLSAAEIQTDMNTPVGGVVPPVQVVSPTIADGSNQRSMVRSLTVPFGGVVNLGANAFTLTGSGGLTIPVSVASAIVNGKTVATLTFSGAGTETGSLADGRYTLSVNGAQVTDGLGRALDGDANGTAGGNYALAFFRLFGDVDGNATVDLADLDQFRSAFNTNAGMTGFLSYLDADQNGTIDLSDLSAFRSRFNVTLGP